MPESTDGVAFYLGDAAQMSALLPDLSFDVVLCHNLLEYLDDPDSVLRAAARALRDDSAILSIVVRNQAGEVLKAAIQAGDLAAAEQESYRSNGEPNLSMAAPCGSLRRPS